MAVHIEGQHGVVDQAVEHQIQMLAHLPQLFITEPYQRLVVRRAFRQRLQPGHPGVFCHS